MNAVPQNINEQALARPLYLTPKRPARIHIDGPAIKVQQAGFKPSHIPLRLISRICLSDRVSFNSDFILACAERGIILVIQTDTGEPIARLLGTAPQPDQWLQRLLDFTARPDWQARYEDWHYAQQRRIAAVVTRRLQAPRYLASHPDHLQSWIESNANQLADQTTAGRTRQKLQQIAYVWMLLRLQRDGLDATSEVLRAETPDLATDLSQLLARRLEPIRLKLLRRRHEWSVRMGCQPKPLEDKDIISAYEAATPRIDRLGQDLLNKLRRWLVEMH